MGYYLRLEEILSLQLKSQEQIERWKEELQEVGKTLEVLGDTNELQGEAGTKLKDNIKNIHMPIKTEIEALLDLFQENYSKYVLGFMELEESNTAIIKQDVLERQQKQLNLYKESYTDIYENIVDELSKVDDLFSYSIEFQVPEKIDTLMVTLTDINEKIGEYDVSHANDMSLLDEGITLMRMKFSK